ncbi:MAG: dynamin family protein, partial [Gammaproteobacteria bacterium]|nr:dynamin family protein [Gammaproteobacteria bacterium]
MPMHEQFSQQLEAYSEWKLRMVAHIRAYQEWLLNNGLNEPEDDLRIFELVEALKSDALTVAFVAEFSRGKTELINGIFFADYQRRLLPSSAGRTTMCPTELFYDKAADRAYIRLLPIETRSEDTTIAQYKHNPMYWTTIDLDTSSPDIMAESFKEIVRVKNVSVAEAERIGLYHPDPATPDAPPPAQVEVPVWRHAMISFPHALLKQGLVVLDTPGLNALGNEPELTMEMIPAAQAVMFILAADTGVTKTDLDMWKHCITPHMNIADGGVLAILNKVDTLWDDLKHPADVTQSIESQCIATAEMLGLNRSQVFPLSAQKGLLAKVKQDTALLARSGLLPLEQYLSEHVVPSRQRIVRDNVVSRIGARIESTQQLLQGRFNAAQGQLNELRSLSGKNTDVILQLMNKAREAQANYKKNVENFQTSRHVLTQ